MSMFSNGQTVGKYQIEELLSQDVLVETYAAKAPDGSRVKLNQIKEFSQLSGPLKAKCGATLNSWSEMSHPFIENLLEFSLDDGDGWFVTSFKGDRSLKQVVDESGRFKHRKFFKLAEKLGASIVYMQSLNINIGFMSASSLYIGGDSPFINDLVSGVISIQQQQFKDIAHDKLFFVNSEAEGRSEAVYVDDLYSFSAMMYYMLTGKSPEGVASGEVTSIKGVPAQISGEIIAGIAEKGKSVPSINDLWMRLTKKHLPVFDGEVIDQTSESVTAREPLPEKSPVATEEQIEKPAAADIPEPGEKAEAAESKPVETVTIPEEKETPVDSPPETVAVDETLEEDHTHEDMPKVDASYADDVEETQEEEVASSSAKPDRAIKKEALANPFVQLFQENQMLIIGAALVLAVLAWLFAFGGLDQLGMSGEPEIEFSHADNVGEELESSADAIAINIGERQVRQARVGSSDRFVFNLAKAQEVCLYSTGNANVKVNLYNDRDRLIGSNSSGSIIDSKNFRLTQRLKKGSYSAEVVNLGGKGVYSIHLDNGSIPGEQLESASWLSPGGYTNLTLEKQKSHYFLFKIKSRRRRIEVFTTGSNDMSGRLLNSRGRELKSDDDSGPGENFKIKEFLDPGTYVVQVRRVSGDSGNYSLFLDVK